MRRGGSGPSGRNGLGIVVFLAPVLVLYAAFFIYPLFFIGFTSLMEWNGISSARFVGLENYGRLFSDATFKLGIRNNFIWAFASGFIQIPLATLVALILARKVRFWKFLRTLYFLPNVISAVALAMLWKAIYNPSYGLLNGLLALAGLGPHNWLGDTATALPAVITQSVLYIGYFMIIILAAITTIPDSLYEAAEIDGASVIQQTFKITIPMITGTLVTSITLAMAYGMRHFEATFLMTGGGPAYATTTMGIQLYNKMDAFRYGEASAIGAILILLGTVLIVAIRALLSKNDPMSEAAQ
ncbi:carbohydrate ABC transporter permease [Gracilinema caldarium]|uniref:carbohydrate ABC transporter permease n=1 Tax=Gracilinema caldarium TaxID=215591 RepID=UPI0026EA0149|nr:sugar ABC transporter permease [Gracilinema caldarium]